MKIHVLDKNFEVDDDFLRHYETMLGGPLQNMALYYIAGHTDDENVEKAVARMTEEEIKEIVLAVANEELEMNGVPYRDFARKPRL